ncbi:MAG: hypothetical protein LBF51_06635 [Zoogloeaceae bacterium]|nr:hypothetical protein [Zoogloeaceae bacterium]
MNALNTQAVPAMQPPLSASSKRRDDARDVVDTTDFPELASRALGSGRRGRADENAAVPDAGDGDGLLDGIGESLANAADAVADAASSAAGAAADAAGTVLGNLLDGL